MSERGSVLGEMPRENRKYIHLLAFRSTFGSRPSAQQFTAIRSSNTFSNGHIRSNDLSASIAGAQCTSDARVYLVPQLPIIMARWMGRAWPKALMD